MTDPYWTPDRVDALVSARAGQVSGQISGYKVRRAETVGAAQEAIRAVPRSLRQAGYALGATQWQTIWHHVLPGAMPGTLTGTILAMSRAIGETAPLVVVGAATYVVLDPAGPFSRFTALPIQIYQWTARPQEQFRNLAAAAILVLLVLLLSLNASAILLRNHYAGRRG